MNSQTHEQQRKNTTLRPADKAALEATVSYIAEHFREPISLTTLCSIADMSPSKLTGLYKLVHHRTPIEYVRALRLEHARDRLVETDMSLRDIAYDLGFAHQGSFSEAFKALFGTSPLAYRKAHISHLCKEDSRLTALADSRAQKDMPLSRLLNNSQKAG